MAGAGLPPLPLKGPFVEFPAMGGPDLAKLGGAGGLLYPPAPPFLYSPPFCPDPPLLQVRGGAGGVWDFQRGGRVGFLEGRGYGGLWCWVGKRVTGAVGGAMGGGARAGGAVGKGVAAVGGGVDEGVGLG